MNTPYVCEYNNVRYTLKFSSSEFDLYIKRLDEDAEETNLLTTSNECIRLLLGAIMYKEVTPWKVQEHIREVLGEDGIE